MTISSMFHSHLILAAKPFAQVSDDPLAQLNFVEDDYAWATAELFGVAADVCNGRLVSTLEGGYNLDALSNSVATHVRIMMET